MTEGLTQLEQDLLTHVEVYGMTPQRAAEVLGIEDIGLMLHRAPVKQAREAMRMAVRKRHKITKDDVIEGMKVAIDQGYQLGDPMAQIRGWSEIGKLLDFYSPTKISVQLTGTVSDVRKEMAQLDDASLLSLVDDTEDVIDADFYHVAKDDEAGS